MEGAPQPDSASRHHVAAWLAFKQAKGLGEGAGPVTADEQSQRTRQLLLKNDFLEEELAILRGDHTANTVFLEELGKMTSDLTSLLRQKLENEYPALTQGKSLAECRELGRALVDQIFARCQRLADLWTA